MAVAAKWPGGAGSEGGRRGETGRERLCTDPRSARQEEDQEQKEGKAPVYMIRREKIFFPYYRVGLDRHAPVRRRRTRREREIMFCLSPG